VSGNPAEFEPKNGRKRRFARFGGWVIDHNRGSLSDRDMRVRPLRPKSFDVLCLLLLHAGEVVSKDELLRGVWGHTNLDEDGLIQCVRDIRVALDDTGRTLLRTVPKRGYLLEAGPVTWYDTMPSAQDPAIAAPTLVRRRVWPGRRWLVLATLGGCLALLVSGALTLKHWPPTGVAPTRLAVHELRPTISDDGSIAEGVTERLVAGLSRVDGLQVTGTEAARRLPRDYELFGTVGRGAGSAEVQVRLVEAGTGATIWSTSVQGPVGGVADVDVIRTLSARVGSRVAVELNRLREGPDPPPKEASRSLAAEAAATFAQMSAERQHRAEAIYQQAIAADPSNRDAVLGLMNLQMIGVINHWYPNDQADTIAASVRGVTERVLARHAHDLEALRAQCYLDRFAGAFEQSVAECLAILRRNPWDVRSIKEIGFSQIMLGRLEDALDSFATAESLDPVVPLRWTWEEGAGLVCLLLDRNAEAADWLNRSLDAAPGGGRANLLLAVAYARLGRPADAKVALAAFRAANPAPFDAAIWLPASSRVADPAERGRFDRLTASTEALPELGVAPPFPGRP